MSVAMLVEFYRELPEMAATDDPDLSEARIQDAIRRFRRHIRESYTEGTLQRLLHHDHVEARRAAVLALGLIGTEESNPALARMLHDTDELVARIAGDSLWELWFRAGTEAQNNELRALIHLDDFAQMLAGLDDLIRQAPGFAEVWNQRAILYFRRGEYQRAISDCRRVVELNPWHFGAHSGMGQCYMKLNKPQAAIRAFRMALQINPTLTHLEDTIRALQESLGDPGD